MISLNGSLSAAVLRHASLIEKKEKNYNLVPTFQFPSTTNKIYTLDT